MSKGIIYIMYNPSFKENMVKIGYTTGDVEVRRKNLSTTALPYEYEVYATYETTADLGDKKLHQLIDKLNPDLRVKKNREFFVMTPEQAYELLKIIATLSGTEGKLTPENKVPKHTKQQVKKPPINFGLCGIPNGAELVFTEDPSVKVRVISDRKVQYGDEITSLSAIAGLLKHAKAVQGPAFFTYNGRLITEIAEETQWKDI